jgi:phosphoribosylformimino-5-aminoimidazole carboxamide ribotide isomerase
VFARLYKQHGLEGGHVIKLGPGNDEAALEALVSWPGLIHYLLVPQMLGLKRITSDSLQIGGGINETNAKFWIDAGASKVE